MADAFLAASRYGDFDALLAVLDPDVVLRLDRGAIHAGASKQVRGASDVVKLGFRFAGSGWIAKPALVNGAPGIVVTREGHPASVVGFTILRGKVAAIDILADPARLRRLDLTALDI